MIKYTKLIAAALISAALYGCSQGTPEEVVSETEVSPYPTEAQSDYILVRGYPLTELFADISAGGVDFSFPVKASDFTDGGALADTTYSDSMISFPSGGALYAEICGDSGDTVNSAAVLQAKLGTAPVDFTVYGIKFGMSYGEAAGIAGVPNQVYGEPDKESGSCLYRGAGNQQFEIKFENNMVTEFIFVQ
ncbi:MAG: hypothetical protein ACI4JF_05760 [Oscillospiraceae bacterium]